jgi:hypothetical protein
MSMHKIPLTEIERDGLQKHGLDIGKPSQLSDVFRQGVAHGLLAQPEQEPVAWINKDSTYVELSTKSTVYGSHTIPLFIHPPAAFVPITADMVSNDVWEAFIETPGARGGPQSVIAAAVNAWGAKQ